MANKIGQAWSLDAMIGVFLFVVILIAVITFSYTQTNQNKIQRMQEEGEKVFSYISENTSSFEIEPESVDVLINMSYDDIKQQLNLRNDFCVYLVDPDGNLIFLDNESNVTGIGSDKIEVNGISCTSK